MVRATLMAVIYLLARQADHRGAPLNALAVACGAAAARVAARRWPTSAFWLTFGATLGIMVGIGVAGAPAAAARAWLRLPAALLLASLCAELALFPVGALVFSRVTFAGLVLNFVAIPLMTVVQVAGMAGRRAVAGVGARRGRCAASSRTSARRDSCGARVSSTWRRGSRIGCRRRTRWRSPATTAAGRAWLATGPARRGVPPGGAVAPARSAWPARSAS